MLYRRDSVAFVCPDLNARSYVLGRNDVGITDKTHQLQGVGASPRRYPLPLATLRRTITYNVIVIGRAETSISAPGVFC